MLINYVLFFGCCFLYLIGIFYCTHYIQNGYYSCKKNNKFIDSNNYESIENNNFV